MGRGRRAEGFDTLRDCKEHEHAESRSGEELPHINTQLFGILDEENRGRSRLWYTFNEPRDGQAPTMDGFLTDYISMLMVESELRQPTHEEYAQIMGRLHARADARSVGAGAGLCDLRSLVLRRADLHVPQPVVLPRRDLLGLRGEHEPAAFVPEPQRRGDAV